MTAAILMQTPHAYTVKLREALRAAREREKLTPEDLADLVGVSRSAIYSWENEISVPVADNYQNLLDVLPALAGSDVPRPASRDIPKPPGRPAGAVEAEPLPAAPSRALALRSPLIAFGMALGRVLPALAANKGTRAHVVSILRDGAEAGLTIDEIASAIEGVEPP